MAELTWFTQSTGNVAFTLSDIDQIDIESEFSELVYGLIENANAPDFRRSQRENDTAEMYQQEINRQAKLMADLKVEFNAVCEERENARNVIDEQKKLIVSLKAEMNVYKEQLEIETDILMNGETPILPLALP